MSSDILTKIQAKTPTRRVYTIEEDSNKATKALQSYLQYSNMNQLGSENSSTYKEKILFWLKDVFLPQGYPHSVSSDYLQYQVWDSCQAYCSNLAGALSLHSTFVGIGVGKEAASPLAAALSWLMKDGTGMISSISFAYWKGTDLDNNSKQWRLFADVANDCANFVKLLAHYLPFPFVLTFCFSSVISSLVGVAGGCTRASLIQHQALSNNMADVSAKDGSQETLVNLAGLVTSLTLLPFLTSTPLIMWITFILCVSLHLYSNYRAMRTVQMKTVNRARLLYILQHWLKFKAIPDILTTNQEEPMLFGAAFQSDYFVSSFRLEMGVSLAHILKKASKSELADLQQQYQKLLKDKYMLFVCKERRKMLIAYNSDATTLDFLRSFYVAYVYAINNDLTSVKQFHEDLDFSYKSDPYQRFPVNPNAELETSFQQFLSAFIEAGWETDPLRLNIGEWKMQLSCEEDKKEK